MLHKNKTFHSYFFLLFFLLLIEVIFKLITGSKIFNFSFLRIFFLHNILAALVGYFTSLFKTRTTYIINSIIVFAYSIYALVQVGFYNYIGVYMSVNASGQLGAVTSYIVEFIKSLKIEYFLLLLPSVLSIILAFIIVRVKKRNKEVFKLKKRYKYQNVVVMLALSIVCVSYSLGFYYLLDEKFVQDTYQVVSNKELFLSGSNPSLCIKEFGIVPFSFIDLKTLAIDNKENELIYAYYTGNIDSSRDIDDSAWQEINNSENTEIYKNLNNYYLNSLITDKNEYTGIFKDKNLIVVMLESVNDIIFNKKYFPNFYKMATSGWNFENNYSPRNSCATGNNEFSAMTGLYSIYNTCTSNTYLDNTYHTSIFNLFNNKGYYTNSMHNYDETYYYRSNIHQNMYSQKYYGIEDLKIDWYQYYGGWSSDVDFINKYFEIMDQTQIDGPFMSFLTTVSSHQPYSSSSPFGDMYLDLFEDTSYSMDLKRYLSKLKVVDNALGLLLEGLDTRNILDDTVIVLFGDHYPYGLSNEILNEILDRDLNDYENEKVPFVIYNSKMESKTFDMYTSYLNLTPTIANLFDLDFDPRLYAGVDIFSESYENMVVFADSSWKNDLAYYNATSGQITYYTDFEYEDEKIKEINTVIYAKMNASALSIKYNYFNYLENALKSIKERNKEA